MSNNKYPINEIFASIQGEGAKAGTPAFFVRLQGCNLVCPFCDTKYALHLDPEYEVTDIRTACADKMSYTWMTSRDILSHLGKLRQEQDAQGVSCTVLTGGEPCIYDLEHLIAELQEMSLWVALETNGTQRLPSNPNWVCVSPKFGVGGAILLDEIMKADEVKFVVGKQSDLAIIQTLVARMGPKPKGMEISLQPISLSETATDLCVAECKRRGWRLSLQIHKMIGVE